MMIVAQLPGEQYLQNPLLTVGNLVTGEKEYMYLLIYI